MGETTSEGRGRRTVGGRHGRIGRLLVGAVLLVTGFAAVADHPAQPAAASSAFPQTTLVRDTPTGTTPHVTNGEVRTVAVAGDTVFLGGDFTAAANPDRSPVDRSYILAFDRTTGLIRQDWDPVFDRDVFKIVAAPDGQSIYVGGRFNNVDGVTSHKVARLSVATGQRMPFQSGIDAVVTAMDLQGDRLIIGGLFSTVQGRNRRVAALDAQTGVVDDSFDVAFSGTHRGSGDGKIWSIEASPDGQYVMVVGSFSTVGGLPRNQVVKLDTGGPGPVTVSSWGTSGNVFGQVCGSFTFYVTDVSISPDSSYFVIVTTGAKGTGVNGYCDSVSRWENNDSSSNARTWVEYSGGDSYYSVEVTSAAVYVGGHFRWSNNPNGSDSKGSGAVDTEGIAALDPENGLPLSWNPGRDRGRAVWQMLATQDGLYVASDTDRIAGGLYRGRIAFFPLAGGNPVPRPPRADLPVTLEQLVTSGADRIVARGYDGTSMGSPSTVVSDVGSLSGVRAAWLADDVLYTAHSNGTLQARPFAGSTLGAPTTVDLHNQSSFASDMANMNGAVYDQGRLYYTRSGSSTLYMRYFSTESRIVGAQRFSVASGYLTVGHMVVAGEHVYYVNRLTGALLRATWSPSQGIVGSSTTVSPANAGGVSWTNSPLWLRQAQAPNQPPTIAASGSCTGMACTFEATASDPDGEQVTVAWDFGDGTTASGSSAQHTFSSTGGQTVTVTATDADGATASTTVAVTTADLPPEASFTVTCANGTCGVDGSASSDPDGQVVSWAWDYGDGGTGSGPLDAHTYAESGPRTITLTVTDNRGQTASTTRQVEVEVPDPGAERGFVAVGARTEGDTSNVHPVVVPAAAQAGDQLLLFASTNGNVPIDAPAGWTREADVATGSSRTAAFSRTAGAGDPGSTVTVTLGTWARADVVVAAYRNLELGDVAGTSGYTTPTRTALPGDWVVSYWADKSAANTGYTAPAGVTTRHAHANSGAGHVSELLGDSGTAVGGGSAGGLAASVPSQSSNATALTLLLRPADGTVPNQPPTVTASGSCTEMTCTFSADASDPDGFVAGIAWDFGDGATAPGPSPTHTYATTGPQTATVTVTDDAGATASDTVTVVTSDGPAVAEHVAVSARTEGNTSTTHPVEVPAEVQEGDQLLLFATSNVSAATSLDAPTGWTRVLDANTASNRTAVFSRTATAGDAGSTVVVTLGAFGRADVVLAAYRGVEVGDSGGTSGYTTPQRLASAGDWAVSYWSDKSASTSGWTAPAGVTTRHSHANSGAGHVAELLVDSGGPVAGGTVGGLTAAPIPSTVSNAVAVTVVLTPLG